MIKLYDLAGADENRRFSPYCWRIRMSLAHKGLEVDCVPWRFTEKEKIAFSGQERVPVLVDGDKTVSDSWNIAKYLETQYPDSPSLKLENGEVLFLKFWTETVLHPGLIKLLLLDVHNSLTEKDKIYFRESREKLFGKTLEEVVNGREERLPNLQKLLTPLSLTLKQQEFLAGESPGFSDYIVFGAFQWARCISDFSLLQADDSIYEWREKMLGLHDGLAGNAVGYSV
ncbi:MAG: glutathione S-transferase family protein [SAR324 cluster bacterium]|nr:glutathione S-transferase family protein [SAR324 cluster bacterium]MCH2265337.1 glutathione S-transferase family protein [SAR324 cluster bacterium]